MQKWEIPVRRSLSGDMHRTAMRSVNGASWARLRVPSEGLGSGVYAIVTELTALLDGLVRRRVSGAINLHSPPTSDLDRSQLREVLGDGEVQATFHADGVSRFSETGIPGVWWVEHRDRDGDLIAELLEVAPVPEILCSAPDEIAVAVDVLQARMLAMADLLPARIAGERNR